MITDAGFVGAKAALFCGDSLLTYLRDDHPGLPWAGWWDLPGGGRNGDESPETCLLREVAEEFGLILPANRLTFRCVLPSVSDADRPAVFFAAEITAQDVAAIRFGDEGQRWEMMPIPGFLTHPRAIPAMKQRVELACQNRDMARA